jgi:hypothetical protein
VGLLILLLLVSCLTWGTWFLFGADKLLALSGLDPAKLESLSKFGDLFGGLNALFTATAFSGLIWSGVMQRKELELQRAQLRLQSAAIERQTEQIKQQTALIEKSNAAFDEQSAEHFFFQVLSLLESKTASVGKYFSDQGAMPLRQASHILADKCRAIAATNDALDPLKKPKYLLDQARKVLGDLTTDVRAPINEVARTSYQLLDFIDGFAGSAEKKYRCSKLLRNQLGPDFLLVLGVRLQARQDSDKFKKLIEKYSFFKGLDKSAVAFLDGFFMAEAFHRPTVGTP